MQQFLKFYYLTFMYSSTCFGRPPANHQELNNCSSSLWFHCWSVVLTVLLVVVGLVVNRPDHEQQHCYLHAPNCKTRGYYCSCLAPDDGREDARNMLSRK
jgi:hypothetical protein